MTDLSFKLGNPGCVRFGNFINYYQFHPPEKRINLLPVSIWDKKMEKHLILDIGCNAGDLTKAVFDLFYNDICKNTTIYGIDIDPILIKRAKEKYSSDQIVFECLDIMSESETLNKFLNIHQLCKFTTTFCFSVTMWIHLNHGDNGLKKFLTYVSKISDVLVIEPQPWKCYKTAVKRLKLNKEEFPLFKSLEIRENVEHFIEEYLINNCNMKKVCETARTEWGRKLLIFNS